MTAEQAEVEKNNI